MSLNEWVKRSKYAKLILKHLLLPTLEQRETRRAGHPTAIFRWFQTINDIRYQLIYPTRKFLYVRGDQLKYKKKFIPIWTGLWLEGSGKEGKGGGGGTSWGGGRGAHSDSNEILLKLRWRQIFLSILNELFFILFAYWIFFTPLHNFSRFFLFLPPMTWDHIKNPFLLRLWTYEWTSVIMSCSAYPFRIFISEITEKKEKKLCNHFQIFNSKNIL